MKNSSLIEILSKLNTKEIKLLGLYLNSPLFNTNKNIIKLYDYLVKIISKKNGELLEKKLVFRKLFHDKPYNDSFMRKLISDLNRCTENFLSFKKYSDDDFGRKKYLLEVYDERGLNKQFGKEINALIESLEKSKEGKNREYFYRKYTLEYMLNYYLMKIPRPLLKAKEMRTGELENESSSLAIFFLISVMKRYLYLLNEKLLYPAKFNRAFYEEITKYAEIPPFKNVPMISFYYKFIGLLSGKYTVENYNYVKKFLFENYRIFEINERYTHFTFLANINIVGARADDNEETFSLYRFMLEEKISMKGEENIISESKFNAISIAAASLKKTEWLKWFINNFKNKLPEKVRDNTVNYCMALLHYQKGDNEKTLFYLNKVKQDKLFSKLRVKSLLIRVYYELGHYQESLDQIDSFRHFISSSRFMTKDFTKRYGKFIKLTRRLVKIKSGSSKEKISDLKYDVLTGESFLGDNWFKSKIKEIENQNPRR